MGGFFAVENLGSDADQSSSMTNLPRSNLADGEKGIVRGPRLSLLSQKTTGEGSVSPPPFQRQRASV